MQHPYGALRGEYARLLATLRVTRADEADAVARKLLSFKARYAAVAQATARSGAGATARGGAGATARGGAGATGVPVVVLAALHWRESSADFRTNLAQGDPLDRPSVHVPRGRPKLRAGMSFPVSWEYAAIDAIEFDHLNDASATWSLPYACWKGEAWNGFGPRNHGIHTGYLWAGTNHYVRGKYVADGRWDPGHVDRQLGMVPIMLRMIALDPGLALAGMSPAGARDDPAIPPRRAPEGVGGSAPPADALQTTRGLQILLNSLGVPGTPLAVDGSYGRRTRETVRAFQRAHGLEPDGLAGPLTRAALARAEAGLA
jgi:lysozyme family protein